jgi:hypothetical protein
MKPCAFMTSNVVGAVVVMFLAACGAPASGVSANGPGTKKPPVCSHLPGNTPDDPRCSRPMLTKVTYDVSSASSSWRYDPDVAMYPPPSASSSASSSVLGKDCDGVMKKGDVNASPP